MAQKAILELSRSIFRDIIAHVLPLGSCHEEAVFIFARHDVANVLTPVGAYFVPPEGFKSRSSYYLELTEEVRRAIFKQAHNLSASIIEIHSHPMQIDAYFSATDVEGFREFVPIARWRTKNRPYAAVVIAQESFDSLAWFDTFETPIPMAIRLDDETLRQPTGKSHYDWGRENLIHGYSIPEK
jgi:hypothetical protein